MPLCQTDGGAGCRAPSRPHLQCLQENESWSRYMGECVCASANWGAVTCTTTWPEGRYANVVGRYTAHHMLVSTLHSIEMFRPFLPSNASDYPFWRSWILHVNVVAMLMRPSYTWAYLVELDNLQYDLHTTFFSVPEYKKFWLPKWL